MNFFENIDWEKYNEICTEKALNDLKDRPKVQLPEDLSDDEYVTKFIADQLKEDYIFVQQRFKYHRDYIWLMESPPMKEGWVQPTFKIDPDKDILYTYPG